MKIARFVVALLMLSGTAYAQDAQPSPHDAGTQTIFSAGRLAIEVARVQKQGGSSVKREPVFTKEKLSRPTVIVGLLLMTTGAVVAATAGESVTMTLFNPITQLPITSTISVTNNGKRWVGIGMLGSGAVLTFLGLSE